eukprot:4851693-Prymnesium_polylepis.1
MRREQQRSGIPARPLLGALLERLGAIGVHVHAPRRAVALADVAVVDARALGGDDRVERLGEVGDVVHDLLGGRRD